LSISSASFFKHGSAVTRHVRMVADPEVVRSESIVSFSGLIDAVRSPAQTFASVVSSKELHWPRMSAVRKPYSYDLAVYGMVCVSMLGCIQMTEEELVLYIEELIKLGEGMLRQVSGDVAGVISINTARKVGLLTLDAYRTAFSVLQKYHEAPIQGRFLWLSALMVFVRRQIDAHDESLRHM
jgi:hypothetical protein